MPYRLAASFHAEGAGTAAFSGTVRWNATLVAVEPADTIALAGLAGAIATLAVTEAADTAAISGLAGVPWPACGGGWRRHGRFPRRPCRSEGQHFGHRSRRHRGFRGLAERMAHWLRPKAPTPRVSPGSPEPIGTLGATEAADAAAMAGSLAWAAVPA
jgi:hypothetical protein